MVNGQPITRNQLIQELLKRAGQQLLDFMIEDRIRQDAIRKSGVTVAPKEVQQKLDQIKKSMPGGLFEQQLKRSGMTMSDLMNNLKMQVAIEKIVRANIQVKDEDLDQVHARHILVRAQPGKDEAETKSNDEAARKKIDEALAKLKNGSDFAQITKEYSDDSTKDNGGDLGWFGRRRMVPEFEKAAFSQPVGVIGDPIKTVYGYHIIKVEERKLGKDLNPEDKAKEMDKVIQERLQMEIQRWLQEIRQKAKVEKAEKIY